MNKIFNVLKRNICNVDLENINPIDFDKDPIYDVVVSSKINEDDLQVVKDNFKDVGMIIYLAQGPFHTNENYLENLEESLNKAENITMKEALYIAFSLQEDKSTFRSFPYQQIRDLNKINKENITPTRNIIINNIQIEG